MLHAGIPSFCYILFPSYELTQNKDLGKPNLNSLLISLLLDFDFCRLLGAMGRAVGLGGQVIDEDSFVLDSAGVMVFPSAFPTLGSGPVLSAMDALVPSAVVFSLLQLAHFEAF